MHEQPPSGLAWAPETRARTNRTTIDDALRSRLPVRVRLPDPFPVWDQARVPCCVACTVATAMELLDARNGAAIRLSPLFNYYLARPSRNVLTDVEIADALRWATRAGVCPYEQHALRFDESGALTPPSNEARTAAAQMRLRLFPEEHIDNHELAFLYFDEPEPSNLQSWKVPLAKGFPLILGFTIADHYRRLAQSESATLTGIDAGDRGHAVVAVGYDDNALGPGSGAVRIKDSRGDEFADHGHWWLPYSLIRDGIARELWVVTAISYDT